MKDCRLIMTVKNNVVNCEGREISMEELATLSGFLQVFAGTEALKRGLDMDEVKNNMLDIHLAAMETLEDQVRDGTIKVRGSP